MFSSRRKTDTMNTSMINTIIGNNSTIEGILTASESTRIDGLLEGKIMSESSVIVGESGTVRGDIAAVEILVAGIVYGNLIAKERIQLTSTGRVLGDLITKTLVIDEGASFKGNCTMDVDWAEAIDDRPLFEELHSPEEPAVAPAVAPKERNHKNKRNDHNRNTENKNTENKNTENRNTENRNTEKSEAAEA